MEKEKYQAIGKQISAELKALALKYDLSNYGFVGFVGEPGKGHVPLCIHEIVKVEFRDHIHILLAKSVFIKMVSDLVEVAGKPAVNLED